MTGSSPRAIDRKDIVTTNTRLEHTLSGQSPVHNPLITISCDYEEYHIDVHRHTYMNWHVGAYTASGETIEVLYMKLSVCMCYSTYTIDCFNRTCTRVGVY